MHEHHEHHGGTSTREETIALLRYSLHHNEHHLSELSQLAESLERLELNDAAADIRLALTDYELGNKRLELALSRVDRQED